MEYTKVTFGFNNGVWTRLKNGHLKYVITPSPTSVEVGETSIYKEYLMPRMNIAKSNTDGLVLKITMEISEKDTFSNIMKELKTMIESLNEIENAKEGE